VGAAARERSDVVAVARERSALVPVARERSTLADGDQIGGIDAKPEQQEMNKNSSSVDKGRNAIVKINV
jgi:hypothetical protein